MRKCVALMICELIFIFLFVGIVAARTISVCKSGCEYNKIQSAINAASTGDVVEITDGKIYYEGLGIPKTGVVLDCNNAEISGRVIISGSENTIKYCTIFREGYGYGIVLQGAYNNTIEYNEIYYTERGIEIESFSKGNYIYNNNLYSNDFGIFLYFSGGNIIESNNIHENNNDGIRSQDSRFDVINSNHVYSNKEWGIVFNGAKDVNITKNEIDHNVKEGIGIGGGYYGGFLIEDNDIYSNSDGIINYNDYNKIIGNRIYENTNYGVYVGGYINDIRENIIYSNYIGIKDDSPSFFVTDGNYINNNILCPSNTEYDIEIASNYLSSGDDNKCDTTKNWNDTGTIGCKTLNIQIFFLY